MYEYADKSINIANELAQADKSWMVGKAIRFVAARFSVFEASTQTENLAEDGEKYFQVIDNNFKQYWNSTLRITSGYYPHNKRSGISPYSL